MTGPGDAGLDDAGDTTAVEDDEVAGVGAGVTAGVAAGVAAGVGAGAEGPDGPLPGPELK